MIFKQIFHNDSIIAKVYTPHSVRRYLFCVLKLAEQAKL